MTAQSRTTTGGGRFRSVLVVIEVAAAVLVLCGAGLLFRTLDLAAEHRTRLSGSGCADDGAQSADVQTEDADRAMPLPRRRTRFYESIEREWNRNRGCAKWRWAARSRSMACGSGQGITLKGIRPRGTEPKHHVLPHGQSDVFRDAGHPDCERQELFRQGRRAAPRQSASSVKYLSRDSWDRNPIGLRLIIPMLSFGAEAASRLERDRRRRPTGHRVARTRPHRSHKSTCRSHRTHGTPRPSS